MPKILSAHDAVRQYIHDGDTVTFGGFASGLMHPESILRALEERARNGEGPHGLTALYAAGQGDSDSRGLNHLGVEGLCRRVIGGHWGLSPKLGRLCAENKLAGYNLPQGVIAQLFRDIAAGKPGVITHVGLGTFVDPRLEGGKLNDAARAAGDVVKLIELEGEEKLFYPAIPIQVAILRASYGTEIDRIHAAMDEFAEITHLPSHLVGEKFPSTMEELKTYDVVILSDVGANTLLLHPLVFTQSVRFPNRLQLLADYVEQGGALGMMGGYMTFQGIGGKGCYHGSPIEKALPVDFLPYDDRQEHPEGIDLKVDPQRHPALKGLPEEWPYLLGYNKAVAKPGAQVAVEYQGDPILSFYEYGKGRSFAWASDCAPHWMPPAFCEWEYIHLFWKNMIDWVVQR